jgi:hypothetical protein
MGKMARRYLINGPNENLMLEYWNNGIIKKEYWNGGIME